MSVPPPKSHRHTSQAHMHGSKKAPSPKPKLLNFSNWKNTHQYFLIHPHQAPAFGNATGISPHLPKKMTTTTTTTTNNLNNILIPRIKNNATAQACAACKYQRRKCEPNCILSPYFPHNRQAQFLNAHKLFGVSNINKIIRNLSPADKDQAMKTIIFQSDVRANDPVGGCYRIIRELQFMIEYYQAELDLVLHQLSICRAQQPRMKDQQQDDHNEPQYLPFMTLDQPAANNSSDPNSDVINADPLAAYSPSSLQYSYHQQQQQQLNLQLGGINNGVAEDNFILVNDNAFESSGQDDAQVWVQHQEQQERMVLNDAKILSRAENGLVEDEGHENEEDEDGWFALTNHKRRKTS